MNKILVLFSATMIIYSGSAYAQREAFNALYDKEAISFYGDVRFMRARQILSRKQARVFLLKYEESARAYKLFSRKKKVGNAILVPAIGVYVGSIFIALPKSQKLAFWGLMSSAALVCISIPFHNDAKKHLQRSVYLYNREVLSNN